MLLENFANENMLGVECLWKTASIATLIQALDEWHRNIVKHAFKYLTMLTLKKFQKYD